VAQRVRGGGEVNVEEERIVRSRRLAFNSQVKVNVGEKVTPDTVVATTMLPLPRLFFISAFRALPGGVLEGYLAEWLVKPGDEVEFDAPLVRFTPVETAAGEVIAPGGVRADGNQPVTFRTSLEGVIESIVEDSGLIMLREKVDYSLRRVEVLVGHYVKLWGRKLKRYLKHAVGDFVEKGQILAKRVETGNSQSPGDIAFARTPMAGLITDIDLERGAIRIEREFQEVELKAGFFGQISAISEKSIEITATGRRIQGICGIGPESHGRLRVALGNPGGTLTESEIDQSDAGRVVVGGAFVTPEALRKAAEVGVSGIITGGADHLDLCQFLGRDFAAAITGKEKIAFPVVITGEFGEVPMEKELFDFLREHEGSWAHLNPTTHMRAGVIRPEIVVMSGREYARGA
jgi:hypothetical protein